MGTYEGVPVTITKAKVPFLNVALFKGYLERLHDMYTLFDKTIIVTRLQYKETVDSNNGVYYNHWDIGVNSTFHRRRSVFTATY